MEDNSSKGKEVIVDIVTDETSHRPVNKQEKKSFNKLVGGRLSFKGETSVKSDSIPEWSVADSHKTVQLSLDKGQQSQELFPLVKKDYRKKGRKDGKVKKPSKPPRHPKAPLLDAVDMRLVKEISEISTKKRERIEHTKVLKKMKATKSASPSSSSSSTIPAIVVTVLFFLVIIYQGLGSNNSLVGGGASLVGGGAPLPTPEPTGLTRG